jgi:ribosome-binding protein aMBF1 (putative translation factor)
MEQGTEREFSLIRARVNGGHSIRSLAAEVQIDRRTLERLEDGKPVHPAKAKVVADYFEVQVTDLMPLESERSAA